DELKLDAIAARGQAPELPEVGAPECLARRNEITLGQLLIDLHGGVGEALQQGAVERLEAARGPLRLRNGPALRPVVVHEVRVKQSVPQRQTVLVLPPPYEPGHGPLVLLAQRPPNLRSGSDHAGSHGIRVPWWKPTRHPASVRRQIELRRHRR